MSWFWRDPAVAAPPGLRGVHRVTGITGPMTTKPMGSDTAIESGPKSRADTNAPSTDATRTAAGGGDAGAGKGPVERTRVGPHVGERRCVEGEALERRGAIGRGGPPWAARHGIDAGRQRLRRHRLDGDSADADGCEGEAGATSHRATATITPETASAAAEIGIHSTRVALLAPVPLRLAWSHHAPDVA
jgi:hypothetical protein